jgi:hypothetical protein
MYEVFVKLDNNHHHTISKWMIISFKINEI